MQIETMLALQSVLKRDASLENQYRQADMLEMILEINQDVVCHGLCQLEDYESKICAFPMLRKGLSLVRGGIEPQVVESVLLHMAFANQMDLLESLLVMEGVCSIQMLRPVNLTKELLLSYFTFEVQDDFSRRLQHFKMNVCEPLSKKEIEHLLLENAPVSGTFF